MFKTIITITHDNHTIFIIFIKSYIRYSFIWRFTYYFISFISIIANI